MTAPEEVEAVPLSLEETGWLCHLLMGQPAFRVAVMAGGSNDPVIQRQWRLYLKLAAANDKLMGKR